MRKRSPATKVGKDLPSFPIIRLKSINIESRKSQIVQKGDLNLNFKLQSKGIIYVENGDTKQFLIEKPTKIYTKYEAALYVRIRPAKRKFPVN